MDSAQIHLALNHFPIAGIIIAFIISIWGLVSKKDQIKTVGISIAILAALTGAVVAYTGDGAEELVEHKPGVTEHLIHEHEEAADAAMIALHLTAICGIAWLVMTKLNKNHKEKVFIIMLLANLAGAGLVADAAHKGGQIRHDEIRNGVKSVGNEEKGGEKKESESEEKESEEKNEK